MAEELELIPPQPFNNDSPRSSATNNNNHDEHKFTRLPSLLESRNTDSPIPSSFDGEGNGRGLAGIGGRLTDSPTAGMRTDSPFSLNDDQNGSSNGNNDEQDLEDLSMEEVDTNSAAVSDEDAHVQLKDDSSSKALSRFAVNWLFVKRSMRILYMGLQNPLKFPILWFIVAINIASQVLGAWMIQDFLYVLATGKTSDQAKKSTPRLVNGKWINTTYVANYPGISGCLKSGCGTYDGSTVVKAPGDPVKVGGYLADFAWMFCVSMFFVVVMSWTGDIICTIMRRNIALNIQKRLMGNTTNKLLYRLTVDGTMDNIDQRITSDLQVVLDGFCCVIFGNTADYLAYPFVFSITRMSLSFNNTMGPLDDPTKESRVVFLVFGAVLITFLAYFIPMNHVSRIFYRGQKYEGDFRTTHTKTVLSCEQISTLGGEPAERVYAQQQFLRVDANNRVYYIWQGALMFLRLLVSIIIPAMSYISMAIAETRDSTFANFFQKQIGDVFEYFLYIPAMAERLAYACGASHRVGTLLEQMDEFEDQPIYSNCRNANSKIELKNVFANPPVPMKLDRDDTLFGPCIKKSKSCMKATADGCSSGLQRCAACLGNCTGACNTGSDIGVCCVCCGNVTITYDINGERKKADAEQKPVLAVVPEEKVALKTEEKVAFNGKRKNLFENVSLRINAGQSVVIMGPSGCGKSSLLRVIGGLWGIDSGSIERPTKVGKGGVFFLPQRPYTFPGSLRAQVLYPQPDSDDLGVSQKVEEALRLVHLSHLIKKYGLDQSVAWDSVLSISEMQRLNFARMFYHRPLFCLADEATSALDLRLESLCYQKASDFGITMVSVAHRPTVVPHHQFVFEYVTENNSWTLRSADEVKICEKFPIDGFVEDSVIQSEDVPIEEEKAEGFNLKFLRRLWRAFRLAVRSPQSQGTLFLFIMAACVGIYGMMQIIIFKDYGTSKIIAFVVAGDVNSAMRGAGTIIGLNSVSTFMQSISACLGAFLAMKIHRAIITKFHKDYYTPAVPYYMNRIMKQPGIDQRMVQDLAGMREALAWLFGNPFAFFNYRLGLFPLLIVWIILLGYALSMAWGLTTFFLFWIVFSYLSQVFSSHFTSVAIEKRQAAEGDLRLHLGRVLANIESITFFGGQQQELATANELLMNVFYKKMSYVYRCLATSIPTITMYYWLQTGVYVMAAILQIWWTFGSMSNAELFTIINFNIIFAKVTQLVIMSMGGFGAVAGYTHRVMDIIEKAEYAKEMVDDTYSKIKRTNDIQFNELSIQAPTIDKSNARTLVSNLCASVQAGESLCISGPSSSGKTSILRALHGLWTPSSGSVSRPHFGSGGVFFLPQASYASQGTLAAQVVYPLLLKETEATNREIASILAEVGLGEIVRKWGLHKVVHWDYVLSGGEMQRLGFAKLLFHRPKFAVMDEGTSALDLKLEAKCMRAIQKRGITLLSIVTRTSVIPYHQKQLLLASDGSYKIVPVGSNPPPTNDDPKKGTMADIPESDDVLRPSALSVGGPSHVTLHFGEH